MAKAIIPPGYESLGILGKGSFGAVYKVIRKADDLKMALKIMDIDALLPTSQEVLRNETELFSLLNHRNLVKCYETFQDNVSREQYIAMELCEQSLRDYIKECRHKRVQISEKIIWYLLGQILQGVSYLHSRFKPNDPRLKCIIHRDLKPENILLTADFVVKICDFGIARPLGMMSQAMTMAGTGPYMAPEIIQSQSYTEKVDVWSIGCIAYELCTLTVPRFNSFFANQQTLTTDPTFSIPSTYSSGMHEFIASCLVTRPDERLSVYELLNLPEIKAIVRDSAVVPASKPRQQKTETHPAQKKNDVESAVPVSNEPAVKPVPSSTPTSVSASATLASAAPPQTAPEPPPAQEQAQAQEISWSPSFSNSTAPQISTPQMSPPIPSKNVTGSPPLLPGYTAEHPKIITKYSKKEVCLDRRQNTNLMLAVMSGASTPTIRANLHLCKFVNKAGETALHMAVERQAREYVELLAPQEATIRLREAMFSLPPSAGLKIKKFHNLSGLMLAALYGLVDIVRILVPYESGLQCAEGYTALMFAILTGSHNCAMLLLHEAMRLTTCGETALMFAARMGNKDMVDALIPHETKVVSINGTTALMEACKAGQIMIAKRLMPYEGHQVLYTLRVNLVHITKGYANKQAIKQLTQKIKY